MPIPETYTRGELAERIRTKTGAYGEVDDTTLTDAWIKKFPVYAENMIEDAEQTISLDFDPDAFDDEMPIPEPVSVDQGQGIVSNVPRLTQPEPELPPSGPVADPEALPEGQLFQQAETGKEIFRRTAVPLAKAGTQAFQGVGGMLQLIGNTLQKPVERGVTPLSATVMSLFPQTAPIFLKKKSAIRDKVNEINSAVGKGLSFAGKGTSDAFKANRAILESISPSERLFSLGEEGLKFDKEAALDPKTWTDMIVEGIGNISIAMAAGGNTTIGGAVAGSIMEAGPFYEQLVEAGDPHAEEKALAFGIAVAGLEKIGLDKIFDKAPKGTMTRIMKAFSAAFTEGGTEFLESPISALLEVAGQEGLTLSEFGKKMTEAAVDGLNEGIAGFITGGPLSAISGDSDAGVDSKDQARVVPPHLLNIGTQPESISDLGPQGDPNVLTPDEGAPVRETQIDPETGLAFIQEPEPEVAPEEEGIKLTMDQPVAEEAAQEEALPTEQVEEVAEDVQPPPVPEEAKIEKKPPPVPQEVKKEEVTPPPVPKSPTDVKGAAQVAEAFGEQPDQKVMEGIAESRTEKEVGLNNAEATRIREMIGAAKVSTKEKQSLRAAVENAKVTGKDRDAEIIAREVNDSPRALTTEEHAGMVLRSAQLMNERESLQADMADMIESGNMENSDLISKRLESIDKALDGLTEATENASPFVSRAMGIRRLRIDQDTMTVANVKRAATVAKKSKLNEDQTKQIENLVGRLEEMTVKNMKLERQFDQQVAAAAKKEAAKVVREETARTRKRRRSKPDIKAREESIKKKIRAMGVRANDITGIPIQLAALIGELSAVKIEQGVRGLNDVVDAIKADIPDIDERDIYQAIAGRGKKAKKHILTELEKEQRDHKEQAKVMSEINDLINGIEKAASDPATPSKGLRKLRESRRVLQKVFRGLNNTAATASLHVKDEIRYQNIMERVQTARAELQHSIREGHTVRRPDPKNVKNAKRELKEIRDLMKTEDEIKRTAETIEKIKNDDFTEADIPAPRKFRIISSELAESRAKLRVQKNQINEYVKSLQPLGKAEIAFGVIGGIPRALQASFDISNLGRQSILFTAGHPIKSLTDLNVKALGAMTSEVSAEALQMTLEMDPAYDLAEASGLVQEAVDGPISKRTEDLSNRLLERTPILKKVMPGIKASGRHFVAFGNQVRFEYFKAMIATNPDMTPQQMARGAEIINILTGVPKRIGPTKQLSVSGPALGILGYAPRFAWSRVYTPAVVAEALINPATRKWMAKEVGRTSATIVVLLSIAVMLGYEVEDDPESTFFGRVRIGNTWVDISGGLIPTFHKMVMLPFLIAMNDAKRPSGESVRELRSNYLKSKDVYDPYFDWLKYKTGPSISGPATLITGRNVLGQEQGRIETILRSLTPFIAQEATEIAGDRLQRLDEKISVTVGAAAGLSTTTIHNEMQSPAIKRVLRSVGIDRISAPRWPEWVRDDQKLKDEFNTLFNSMMAHRIENMKLTGSKRNRKAMIDSSARSLRRTMKFKAMTLKGKERKERFEVIREETAKTAKKRTIGERRERLRTLKEKEFKDD